MYKKSILGILIVVIFFSCKKDWNAHYEPTVKTINTNVWEAIQKDGNLSLFVQYVKKYQFDTLFLKNQTYSLFIPTNEAFAQFIDSANATRSLIKYNITEFFIQSGNIWGKKKVQTLGEKFSLFERNGSGSFLDGISLKFESPLYINGKYFIMDKIAYPKANIYEYFAANNVILKKFIDSQDSIVLDKTKSRPLGFDSLGRTIYDTVATIYNKFEHKYFPVSKESRYKTATIVFPKQEDYNAGLTIMAQTLGGNFHDYKDIPLDWQNKYLVPYLLNHGIFENMLEENEFVLAPGKDTLKLKNILGDSVAIDYTVTQKTLCSNGYAYNYENFRVPDTLWAAKIRFEAEKLLRFIGIGKYGWKDGVVSLPTSFSPLQVYVPTYASNDSVLRVNFPTSPRYAGNFSLTFNVDNLFPRKYLMVVRTHMNYGGIYDIYVNDQLVRNIDYASLATGISPSVEPTINRYVKDKIGNISFDCWVNSLVEYGKAKISFVYRGPSTVLYPALSIDYIDFRPYSQ